MSLFMFFLCVVNLIISWIGHFKAQLFLNYLKRGLLMTLVEAMHLSYGTIIKIIYFSLFVPDWWES